MSLRPGRRLSPDQFGTLILYVQPPELCEKNFCCLLDTQSGILLEQPEKTQTDTMYKIQKAWFESWFFSFLWAWSKPQTLMSLFLSLERSSMPISFIGLHKAEMWSCWVKSFQSCEVLNEWESILVQMWFCTILKVGNSQGWVYVFSLVLV